jgi:hypothetical protein
MYLDYNLKEIGNVMLMLHNGKKNKFFSRIEKSVQLVVFKFNLMNINCGNMLLNIETTGFLKATIILSNFHILL